MGFAHANDRKDTKDKKRDVATITPWDVQEQPHKLRERAQERLCLICSDVRYLLLFSLGESVHKVQISFRS